MAYTETAKSRPHNNMLLFIGFTSVGLAQVTQLSQKLHLHFASDMNYAKNYIFYCNLVQKAAAL